MLLEWYETFFNYLSVKERSLRFRSTRLVSLSIRSPNAKKILASTGTFCSCNQHRFLPPRALQPNLGAISLFIESSVGLQLFKGKPSGLTSNLTISLIALVKGQFKVLIKDYDNSGPNHLPRGQKKKKRKHKSKDIRVHPFQNFGNLPRICSLLRINSLHY